MESNDTQTLLKRLLYRSVHRGCKETDILLGEFAKKEINNFSSEDLHLYKDFIEEDDLNIYNWLLKKEDYPQKYQGLIKAISQFHNLD